MADLQLALVLARRYRPGHTTCPITLFLVESQPQYRHPPQLGWRYHSTGEFSVVPVPGDHGSVMKGKDVTVLATRVGEHLARIDGLAGPDPAQPRA